MRAASQLLRLVYALIAFQAFSTSHSAADDWPGWMGPERNGAYKEQEIVESIPDEGLPIRWRAPVASGYSGPAVAEGKVFVTDYLKESGTSTNNAGGRDKLTGRERIHCFDSQSGESLWRVEYQRPYHLSYPNGPRATPTIDEDRVYCLGAEGDLLCLRTVDGHIVWRKQIPEEFETETPIWGYAAHPLVHGDLLYTMAGGEGSAVIALDKLTGEVRWQALTASSIGYCPPSIYTLGGKPTLIVWHADEIVALTPDTGEVRWSYPLKPRYEMAIAAPQLSGNRLFASGIGETAAMIELDEQGRPADTLWTGKPKIGVYSGNATALFEGDVIYGSDCGTGEFIAVDAETGEQFWTTFELTTGGDRRASHGTAFAVQHFDKHLIFAETGELIFTKLAPEGFLELGRMQVLEPTGDCFGRKVVWSHPAFAERSMFARNDEELVCVSLERP